MNIARYWWAMRRAFTLLELLTTVAIIAILIMLLLPALQNGYSRAKRAACGSNLKNIGVGFHAWAHDHNNHFPMQVSTNQGGTLEFAQLTPLNPDVSFTFRHFQALSNEILIPKILVCPADKQRVTATNFESLANENVSYWINPAAAFGQGDSPVAGDRDVRTSGRIEWTFVQFSAGDRIEFSGNLHGIHGNVLFGDGHVDVLDSRSLPSAFGLSSNVEITLSLPRPDMPSANPSNAGNESEPTADGSSGQGTSTSHANSGADGSNTTNSASDSDLPGGSPRRQASRTNPRFRSDSPQADRMIVWTRLDGTVVTSSPPIRVTNTVAPSAQHHVSEGGTANPLIEFAKWLTKLSARGTYWLLFLLMLALIGFEIARRHARRKRGRATRGF